VTIVPAAVPLSDFESLLVHAVANGWIVTIGFDGYPHNGMCMGEQFVFATATDMAMWMSKTLPQHPTSDNYIN
jgi:hypothetical protein